MRARPAAIGASIFGFLFLWSSLSCARDDEAALRSRVLKEFPEALKVLEEHFAGAVGSVNYSLETRIGQPRHIQQEGNAKFLTRRPYWARVTASERLPAKSSGLGAAGKGAAEIATSSGREIVYGYNEDYSFSLSKKDADPQYIIKSLDKNEGGEPPRHLKVQVDGWLYEYLDAPFSFSAVYQPLSRIISSDRFSIQRVSEVRHDGENCLKLEVRLKEGTWKIAQGKPSPEYAGWILVAPEKKWVVREYELRQSIVALRGRVEYGDIQDGFPLPKRVVTEAMDTRSEKPIFRHEFTFEDLRLVAPPDREFTLAAFGLPELGKPRSSRHANRTVFWLLGAALASLVVAIVLKRYSDTFRQTPSGPVSVDVKPRREG
jgi:hypothetical protein